MFAYLRHFRFYYAKHFLPRQQFPRETWKFIQTEFAFTAFWSSGGEVKCSYLFFPHTNLMISIYFPLNWKHIASCEFGSLLCESGSINFKSDNNWKLVDFILFFVYCCVAAWNLIIYFCSIFSNIRIVVWKIQERSSRLFCLFVHIFGVFHVFIYFTFRFDWLWQRWSEGFKGQQLMNSALVSTLLENLFKL